MAVEITEYELTDCYRCEERILAVVGQVHPLCKKCGESFDDWFQKQLEVFNK